MQITYELTEKDFREALIANRNRSALRYTVELLIWLVVIGALSRVDGEDYLFIAWLFSIGGFFLVYWLWLAPRSSARKQYRKQPVAHGQKMLLADHSGVHFRGEGASSDMEWRSYIKWRESKHLFLLYQSPSYFYMVPKRSMAPEQVEEFRGLLRENVKLK
jgi:YcxB-like protein